MTTTSQTIGDYTIVETLTPQRSYLVGDTGGRLLVLKFVEDDCLLRGRLHPDIHDRLARVRELAHASFANLLGVERDGGRVFSVWQYVPGKTLDRWCSEPDSPTSLRAVVNQVLYAVKRLHALGIVHGRIHARNVIVDDGGNVFLTHISPLLYDDPAVDLRDFSAMVAALPLSVNGLESPLEQFTNKPQEIDDHARAPRRRTLLAAGAILLLAVVLAAGIFHIARTATPQNPVPPEATPGAMQPR